MIPNGKYPVLRNLMIFQVSSIFIGLALLFQAYHYVSEARVLSSISSSRRAIEPVLGATQEQWRVWKTLGQEDILSEEIEKTRETFPLWKIQVLDFQLAPKVLKENEIVFPRPNSQETQPDHVVFAELDRSKLEPSFYFSGAIFYTLSAFFLLFLCIVLGSAHYIQVKIYRPLIAFISSFSQAPTSSSFESYEGSGSSEIHQFLSEVSRLHQRSKTLEKEAVVGDIARQVAHDIRSPLAALSAAEPDISALPEDTRILIRSAIHRIRDIANHLIEKNTNPLHTEKQKLKTLLPKSYEKEVPSLLSSLIEVIISEKRMQYRSRLGIEIEFSLRHTNYGLFAQIQPVEFKIIISNLIDNAVEACVSSGLVRIELESELNSIFIRIVDNGKGIQSKVLSKLTQKGATYGKKGGLGLGLYHARNMVESWGGSLHLNSQVSKGTTVQLNLPQCKPPQWFLEVLNIEEYSTLVVLDDDQSIHQIWQSRMDALRVQEHGVEVLHFSTPNEFRNWKNNCPQSAATSCCLIDNELLGFKESGLDLAEALQLIDRSILVTSRYEEKSIRDRCDQLKIALLPKGMAGFVPIRIIPKSDKRPASTPLYCDFAPSST